VLVLAHLGGSSVIGFLPLYALAHGQEPALWWFFAVYSVWIVLTRLSFRRASDRLGRVRVLAPTIASLALGFLALVPAPTPGRLLAAAVLLGTGTALLYPTLAALVVDRTPEGERGLALGTLAGAFDLSVVVGSAVLGLVAERASFGAAFAVAGTAAALGLPALAVLERARGARSPVARAEV
jgi:MFS family permease